LEGNNIKFELLVKFKEMELAPFDPIDFKKFTDGKTIVKVS